ncbi:hypothetical protein [Frigoriflavimonas asaccharolytica]|uniref:Uncharacterized protein n=1 Tax=Frigoriflavimonas asaccharolytica TaxID=2735899 RepID=A0A8J8GAB7_9FLAO|nr:hypothetical protein [Frigoriflavimonas asaccharolytica]NRS92892.1 hypothetical protein [Frigoriflavimonas asaccharolytica]
MNTEDKNQESTEKISEAQRQKQNQDFENIPAASENQNPPDIDKSDIEKSSETNEEGKMENEEK